MPELHNARYEHILDGGGDPWKLTGEVFGHPSHNDGKTVHVSTPVWFDELEGRLITGSGRNYRISSYMSNKQETVDQIKSDIKHKGYERH
jgi:hypothetical protein